MSPKCLNYRINTSRFQLTNMSKAEKKFGLRSKREGARKLALRPVSEQRQEKEKRECEPERIQGGEGGLHMRENGEKVISTRLDWRSIQLAERRRLLTVWIQNCVVRRRWKLDDKFEQMIFCTTVCFSSPSGPFIRFEMQKRELTTLTQEDHDVHSILTYGH